MQFQPRCDDWPGCTAPLPVLSLALLPESAQPAGSASPNLRAQGNQGSPFSANRRNWSPAAASVSGCAAGIDTGPSRGPPAGSGAKPLMMTLRTDWTQPRVRCLTSRSDSKASCVISHLLRGLRTPLARAGHSTESSPSVTARRQAPSPGI